MAVLTSFLSLKLIVNYPASIFFSDVKTVSKQTFSVGGHQRQKIKPPTADGLLIRDIAKKYDSGIVGRCHAGDFALSGRFPCGDLRAFS